MAIAASVLQVSKLRLREVKNLPKTTQLMSSSDGFSLRRPRSWYSETVDLRAGLAGMRACACVKILAWGLT